MALSEDQKAAKRRYKERHPDRVREQYKRYQRAYYAKNRELILLRTTLRKFGLTMEEYEVLKARADGRCEVCTNAFGKTRATRPRVDHCHTTGRTRGILCAQCNWAIGNARDNPDTLRRLAQYLEG